MKSELRVIKVTAQMQLECRETKFKDPNRALTSFNFPKSNPKNEKATKEMTSLFEGGRS